MRIMVWTALVIATTLALSAPPALAQSGGVAVSVSFGAWTDANQRVMPESEVAQVPVDVTLTFPYALGACSGRYLLKLEVVDVPAFASAKVLPATVSGEVPAATTSPTRVVHHAMLNLTVTRDAPAFADVRFRVRATLDMPSEPCTYDGGSGSRSGSLETDYMPRLKVDPLDARVADAHGKFRINVDNLGNGPTRVRTSVKPENPVAFGSWPEAAEIRLEAFHQKGPSAVTYGVVEVHYDLEDSGPQLLTVTLEGVFDGTASGTELDARVVQVTVGDLSGSATTRGDGGDVPQLPGFAHLAALVSLLGAALWRRRRQA
ncbi:MAG TPA: hypothetical protein VI818_02100 [Candidatus Thermoplasmatota archaeon]|nr:hypothetical protein [Candidatus Thermoplasmatota archaeon]